MNKMKNYHEACILLQEAAAENRDEYEEMLASLGLSPTTGRYMTRIANRFADKFSDPSFYRYGRGALRVLSCCCDSVEEAALKSTIPYSARELSRMQEIAKDSGEKNSVKGTYMSKTAKAGVSDIALEKLRALRKRDSQ